MLECINGQCHNSDMYMYLCITVHVTKWICSSILLRGPCLSVTNVVRLLRHYMIDNYKVLLHECLVDSFKLY